MKEFRNKTGIQALKASIFQLTQNSEGLSLPDADVWSVIKNSIQSRSATGSVRDAKDSTTSEEQRVIKGGSDA